MTPREHAILDFLSGEQGIFYSPHEVAAVISNQGIPTHPSAAGKALRKLARKRRVKAIRENGTEAVILKDQRLAKQGGQQLRTTPVFLYGIV